MGFILQVNLTYLIAARFKPMRFPAGVLRLPVDKNGHVQNLALAFKSGRKVHRIPVDRKGLPLGRADRSCHQIARRNANRTPKPWVAAICSS